LKTKFGSVKSCMHISAVIQSQRRPLYVDSSTGSNSRKAGDCDIMASAVFACVLLRLGGLPTDGCKSVSDRGCERPLRESATPLPDVSGQMARHVHNDFALSNRNEPGLCHDCEWPEISNVDFSERTPWDANPGPMNC